MHEKISQELNWKNTFFYVTPQWEEKDIVRSQHNWLFISCKKKNTKIVEKIKK